MRQFGLIDIFGWTALYAAWFAIWPWSGLGVWIIIVWSLLIAGTIATLKLSSRRTAAIFAIFSVAITVCTAIVVSIILNGPIAWLPVLDSIVLAIIIGALAGIAIGFILFNSVAAADWLITCLKRKLARSTI